jgi:ABC-type Na+ efflux pump permease subunit
MSTKEKKRLSRSAIVLIVGLIIIAIPICIFLGILGISALQTGTPREGSRFDNDLDPAITEENVAAIKSKLDAIGSVEEVEVVLAQGQLRIFIDTNDSLSEEQVDSILTSAYNSVNSITPITTYFTATESKKMYDLQINVYTTAEASEIGAANSRQYKLLHKNSAEETYGIDDLAHPKDASLAAELEGITPVENSETTEGEGGE